MIKTSGITVCAIGLMCLSGCQGDRSRALVRYEDPKGILVYECEEVSGVRDGVYLEYGHKSQGEQYVKYMGWYNNGKEDGLWMRFGSGGNNLESIQEMVNGERGDRVVLFDVNKATGTNNGLVMYADRIPGAMKYAWLWSRGDVISRGGEPTGVAPSVIRKVVEEFAPHSVDNIRVEMTTPP